MKATAGVRCSDALWAILAALAALRSCTGPVPTLVAANDRPFDFDRDTFAFANELPFRRGERAGSAAALAREIAVRRPPVVHVSAVNVYELYRSALY